jgi:hypothetical protein
VSTSADLVASIEAMYGADSLAAIAVREALTLSRRPKRPRRSVETLDYVALVRRLVRRAGQRVADSDEHELRALMALQETLDEALQVAVDGQRSIGRSWAYIGDAAGMKRQSAFERWGGKE